jgi:hypothetical protein
MHTYSKYNSSLINAPHNSCTCCIYNALQDIAIQNKHAKQDIAFEIIQ